MAIVVSGLWDYRISSLGAQALSAGLRHKVEQTFPGQPLQVLYNDDLFKGYGSVLGLVRRIPLLYPPVFHLFYKLYRRLHAERVATIAAADLLVVSGDGVVADLFTPHTVMLAFDIRAAAEAGTRLVSLNQSINITRRSLAAYCVRHYFMTHPISVREAKSQALLGELFGRTDVPVHIDAAFLVRPLDEHEDAGFARELADLKQRHGFDDYVLVGIRGNRPATQVIDTDAWREVVRATAETFGRTVILASTTAEFDLPLARKIAAGCDDVLILPELIDWGRYNHRFFIYLLRQAYANVADRYHQNVFSALAGTPFLPVEGNTSKTSGLVALLGYDMPVLPLPTAANLPAYRDALRHLADHHAEIKTSLAHTVRDATEHYDGYSQLMQATMAG
jgi:polysaccharide pyruvyl transferase WcaK-like protein